MENTFKEQIFFMQDTMTQYSDLHSSPMYCEECAESEDTGAWGPTVALLQTECVVLWSTGHWSCCWAAWPWPGHTLAAW